MKVLSRIDTKIEYKRMLQHLRCCEKGVLDLELITFIPTLVFVLLLLIQGFVAISAVNSVTAASRNAARAAMLSESPAAAARSSVPDWVRIDSVTDDCGPKHCAKVSASIPVGLPGILSKDIAVTRVAYFPKTN